MTLERVKSVLTNPYVKVLVPGFGGYEAFQKADSKKQRCIGAVLDGVARVFSLAIYPFGYVALTACEEAVIYDINKNNKSKPKQPKQENIFGKFH